MTDLRVGLAACYHDSQAGRDYWVAIESLTSDRFQGKELLSAADLPQEIVDTPRATGEHEVFMSTKDVSGLLTDLKETRQLSDLRTYARVKEGFVWRRKYVAESGTLDPPKLPIVCPCSAPLNPDSPYLTCETCNAIFHESCISGMTCPQCQAQLPSSKRSNSQVESPPSKSSETEKKPVPILQIAKYPLLTAIATGDLQTRLMKLAEESQTSARSMSEEERIRQSLQDKTLGALLLAQAEQRSQHPEAASDASLKTLRKIAKKVENALYEASLKMVHGANYGRRARTIVFNLLDEKNADFRGNLLRGGVKPESLCHMDSKAMASSTMKKLREERERRYLEEQLICPTTGSKLIVKTHKGEGIIEVGGEERVVNNDFMDILENLQERGKAERQPMESEDDDTYSLTSSYGGIAKLQEKCESTSAFASTGATAMESDARIEEILRENNPEVIAAKIRKRLVELLKEEQAQQVLKAANIDQ